MAGPRGEECIACYYEDDGICRYSFPPAQQVGNKDWCCAFVRYNTMVSKPLEEGDQNA